MSIFARPGARPGRPQRRPRAALATVAALALAGTAVVTAATTATAGNANPAPSTPHALGAPTSGHRVVKPRFGAAATELGRLRDPKQRAKALARVAPNLPVESTAYHVKQLWDAGTNGAGTAVAVIDSFGDPNIKQVIDQYDQENGLPAADVETITPAGPLPPCNLANIRAYDCSSWVGETDLDVTMIHSLAPGAKIIIAATPVDETQGMTGLPEMMTAINYIADNHIAAAISMSLGTTEETFDSFDQIKTLDPAMEHAQQAKIPVLASSGDDGASGGTKDGGTYNFPVVSWPASDSLVTAIGGTVLNVDGSGNRTGADTLWPQSGGGLSKAYKRPAWQDGVKDTTKSDFRAMPDITMEGVRGTSQAAPLFAAIIALATQQNKGQPLGFLNPALYALGARGGANGIVDVTEGDNSYNGVQGYQAGPGYDVVSGWGTIDAPAFVPALVAEVAKEQAAG